MVRRLVPVHLATQELSGRRSADEMAVDHQARPEFSVFYEHTYRDVAAALSSTLGDRDLGAEAADEAMARCYARWSTVSHYANPAGWVYRVGLNWALSRKRRMTRRYVYAPRDRVEPVMPADPQIAEALSRLDLRLRTVVVCRVLLDWSTDETAAALQVKPGTVKSRLHRGLARLEEMLAHFDEGTHR